MAFRYRLLLVLSSFVLFCGFIGCGSDGEKAVIKGTVKLDGVPLAGAQVRFVPKGTNLDLGTAFTTTGADGTFVVQPDAQKNNLLRPGEFLVLISKVESTDPAGGMGTPTRNLVPEKYNIHAQTPLNVKVAAGDNIIPTFELATEK